MQSALLFFTGMEVPRPAHLKQLISHEVLVVQPPGATLAVGQLPTAFIRQTLLEMQGPAVPRADQPC